MLVFDKNIFGSNREIDSNGYLRVSDCSITKTQVAPYLAQEIPNWKDFGLERDKIYYVLRPESELKKAVETFNNLPLTRKHIEVDVDNVPKEDIIGSLGDSAVFEDGYLKNNLIVYDQKYIDRIENGKQKELSCGYRYTPVRESGEYNGQHYDFVMKDIIGNHVALVKEGRAGHDVMVSDTIEAVKDKIMGLFGKKQIVGDEFKESEHPRAKNGQFTSKGGESSRSDWERRKELVKKELEKLNNPDPKIIKFYGEEIDVTKTDEVRLKEILEELESLHEQGEAQKKIRNELARRKEESSKGEMYDAHKKIGEELIKRAEGIKDILKRNEANKELDELEKLYDRVITSGVLSDDEIDEYSQAYLEAKDYIVSKNTDNDWKNEDLSENKAKIGTSLKKAIRLKERAEKLGNWKDYEKYEKEEKDLQDKFMANDKAIPDELDKPDTAGEVKADKEDKKMDKEEKKESVAEVKEEKVVEDKAVDKRKLIDEIGGILKGKVDDELIRTIIKKAEEIAYNGSEAGKADDEAKKEEIKEEVKEKEVVEDKCGKMAKDEMTFDIDSIKAQVREEVMEDFKAREEARKSVKSTLGEINVMAFDSCEEIYKLACEKAGLNLNEIASYKDAFKGFSAGKALKGGLALDATPKSSGNEECFKNIRV